MRQIDADALKRAVHNEWDDCLVWDESGSVTADEMEQIIDAQPTVDAEPVKHGHWKYDNQYHWYRACCSECGYYRVTDIKADRWNEWKYCPNCGAKMDEVEE